MLERVIRERSLGLRSVRTLNEMATFVWPEPSKRLAQAGPFTGIPQAQPGCNDDLVLALAIGVTVALHRPRVRKTPQLRDYRAELVTGY